MNSFTSACRINDCETTEKPLSSIAKFISLPSKFVRSRAHTSRSSVNSDSVDAETASEFSSTDAGDDIEPTFVDLDDFVSTSSDGEASNDQDTMSPRLADTAAATCVYSVMMLLRYSGIGEDDASTAPSNKLTAQPMSDLPSPAIPKAAVRESWRSADDSWRAASPQLATDSWRQALPESASDSWVAQQRKRSDGAGSPDEDANVVRAARSILNKLTVEKFDSLFEQLANCGISRPYHISMLMREVFEKATTQHHFIPMYAELCVKLEKDPRIAAVVEEADQLQNFRRLLLNQCQSVFEQLLEPRSDEDDDIEEEDLAFRRKQEALGNMKLIGQLLVHGMLSPDLFTACCEQLLRKRMECPEALESLVALMMVAGPKFDYSAWQYVQRLEKILTDMAALTKDKSVAPRLRFLIRDVLEARSAGWPSSRRSVASTPVKLEDVRKATEGETQQPQQQPELPKKQLPAPVVDTKAARPWNQKKSVTFSSTAAEGVAATPAPFDLVTFRRELNSVFTDLASDKNIPGAVQRIRLQQVPIALQADQFSDILTRIVEERRGAVRRCGLAFIVGLAAAEQSAFDREECLAGIGRFFDDVYTDLCYEVHRLPAIMKSEFMPTLLNVLPASEVNKVVPTAMRK